MKKLGLLNKFIFILNSFFALLLIFSLLIPLLPPATFSVLSVLGLVVPLLLIVNFLFVLYWAIQLKKQMILSLIALLLSISYIKAFIGFGVKNTEIINENSLKVMSFNVYVFNNYGWSKQKDIPLQISNFIENESPDIIAFQEYTPHKKVNLIKYPHKYTEYKIKRPPFGQAIYSKYPIVNTGNFDFKNTTNNAIFADVVKGLDTLRVYNFHLQSLSINPNDLDFDQEASRRLVRRLASAFATQQHQVNELNAHIASSPYKTIVMGDLNNAAFSYSYRKLKGNHNDAFVRKGSGLGSTFWLKRIPLRIDFIFAHTSFTVEQFATHTEMLSDHAAISTVLSW